jgi:hypothetical protein
MAKTYRSGQSTAAHDAIDVRAYFSLVYAAAQRHRHGMIVDVFAGGGRDSVALYALLNGEGKFISIDADPQRVEDALLRKKEDGMPLFALAQNAHQLEAAFVEGKVAFLRGAFPQAPFGNQDIDLKGKADFVLCNAGIMFIPPEHLDKTLSILAGIMAPDAEMFLRFSLKRDDQKGNAGYFIHAPELVSQILRREGLTVTRKPDLPDPQARSFSWVDLHCCKS